MANTGDSDEEDTFVTLGNALPLISEDEPRKKPIQVSDIQARDSSGRPRFHGAFTGGFSAGYFNTVGTKEGWTPSEFVSSRDKKKSEKYQQRPEDFMDDDDFSEHGIAPRKFVTASQFSSEERKRRRVDEMKVATSDETLPSSTALLDLVIPEKITIGVKLLRKMGWKEGQGIGPRLSRKKKKQQNKAGQKVYGCAMPSSSSEEDEIDDEQFLKDVTYAPRDATPLYLSAKDNTHGLGYRGLDPRSALPSSHVNLFGPPKVTKSGKKGIRGQAFGVGALEDEDDDVYSTDNMSNYDMTMGFEEDNNFGWTAPRGRTKGGQEVPVGYVGKILEGFSLSSQPLVQKKDFPPPVIPRTFRPVHVFKKPDELEPSSAVSSQPRPTQAGHQDAMSRGVALGEVPFVGSVFDLIPAADRARMDAAKSSDPEQPVPVSAVKPHPHPTTTAPPTGETVPHRSAVPTSQPSATQGTTVANSATGNRGDNSHVTMGDNLHAASAGAVGRSAGPLFQGAAGFKPFAQNPDKQQQYEKYLSLLKQGVKDPFSQLAGESGQMDWDVDREREEFVQAARIYKPLSGMMAARFTSGQQLEDDGTRVAAGETVPVSDAAKAAEMKMYGALTREAVEWHPNKLVCRRFNIPDPYPGSSIVGLATVKRDKYSVFTFLNFPSETAPEEKEELLPLPAPPDGPDRAVSQQTERNKTEADKPAEKKSIFSHLTEPRSSNKPSSKSVSFSIKSSASSKTKEFKSIFSHLAEEEPKKRKLVPMETSDDQVTKDDSSDRQQEQTEPVKVKVEPVESEVTNAATATKPQDQGPDGERPPVDLFRAIFRNTDSEDSSSSEEEEDMADVRNQVPVSHASGSSSQVAMETVPSTTANQAAAALQSSVSPSNQANLDLSSVSGVVSLSEPGAQLASRLAAEANESGEPSEDEEAYGPALPPSLPQTQAPKHIFQPRHKSVLPGNNQEIDSLERRLGPDTNSNNDGSRTEMPSSSSATASVSVTKSSGESSQFIDLTKESKKHKHKHKEKHKRKKDKKEKHKKSKHKKKHKKKEKRKSAPRPSDSSSESSSDLSGTENSETPTDTEILQRMRSLKPGRRLKAADFM